MRRVRDVYRESERGSVNLTRNLYGKEYVEVREIGVVDFGNLTFRFFVSLARHIEQACSFEVFMRPLDGVP